MKPNSTEPLYPSLELACRMLMSSRDSLRSERIVDPPENATTRPYHSTQAQAGSPERPFGLITAWCRGRERAGEQIALGRSGHVTVGRSLPMATGGTFGDATVSRAHARFSWRDGGWEVEDLQSANGSAVNGEPLGTGARRLASGDVVRLGEAVLVFTELPAAPAEAGWSLLGESAAMEAVRRDIKGCAPAECRVLVVGETGTGKELIARELHRLSGRSGPFLAVNCASLSPELAESELFGHVKGAFTGAQNAHAGLFMRANGGTLLLDEVGELPGPLQARLLRVLQERAARPVGGVKEVPVDTRVVAATHRPLAEMTGDASFRLDLYGRLAEATVPVPPLRARREDIVPLAQAWLRERDDRDRTLSSSLVRALLIHPWPLNVRGLFNALAATLRAQPDAEVLHLDDKTREELQRQSKLGTAPPAPPGAASTALRPLDEQMVREAMGNAGGNMAAAARALGIDRTRLYRALKSYGVDPADFR